MKKKQRVFIILSLAILTLLMLEIISIINSKLDYPMATASVILRINEIDVSKNIDALPEWQKEYFSRIDSPVITVSLDHVFIPENFLANGELFCITRLDLTNTVAPSYEAPANGTKGNQIVGDHVMSLISNAQGKEICLRQGKNYILPLVGKPNVIFYDNLWPEYFYPFDQRNVKLNLVLDGYIKKGSYKKPLTESPLFNIIVSRRWQREVSTVINGNNIDLNVSLRRPLIYETLAIFLPFVITLIILSLPKIKDEGSFWEVVAGLTLGLWGIYEVLVPEDYISSPTILTNAILGLYFLLGIVILYELFPQPKQTTKSKISLKRSIRRKHRNY
jgi:hypothetical protein